MKKSQQHQFEERLLEMQESLLGVSDVVNEASATVALDQTRIGRLSRMDAMQQQAMSQATDARKSQQLMRIKHALERLDDDQYGECLVCLEEIPIARLEIDPAIEHCVSCAAQSENA